MTLATIPLPDGRLLSVHARQAGAAWESWLVLRDGVLEPGYSSCVVECGGFADLKTWAEGMPAAEVLDLVAYYFGDDLS